MKKRILSCLLSIAMCLTLLPLGIQAQAAYFGDVTSHWARSYIEDAVDMGLFNGTAPNRFEPESAMTRAMFVTVLYRMDGGEAERSANFIDVPRGSWYSDAVAWASENSIVTGTSAIRFSPNGSVTREQMVTILNRYLTASGAALGSDGEAPAISFRDSSSIAPYAREAVEKMQRASIVSGKPSGFGYRFDPQGCATRAEVACIMCKFLDQLSYDDIDNEEPDPEAAYEQMDKITQSSTLKSLSSQYENASDSQKKNLAEQAISYFEQQEENGTIDYCDVDRDSGVIQYWIDGLEAYYLLYDLDEVANGDASSVNSALTASASTYGTAMVGAASSSSTISSGKALVLESYEYTNQSNIAKDFHTRSDYFKACAEDNGLTTTIKKGVTVADLKTGLSSYDVLYFNMHGTTYEDEPMLCLEEKATREKYKSTYVSDVNQGNIGRYDGLSLTGPKFMVRGTFFTKYYTGYNKLTAKWVHLGTCYGMSGTKDLAYDLKDAGAGCITGYDGQTWILYDEWIYYGIFNYMQEEKKTLGDSLNLAIALARTNTSDDNVGNKYVRDNCRPTLMYYGDANISFRTEPVVDTSAYIQIQLEPNLGTVRGGSYSLYRVNSDGSETQVITNKSFTNDYFLISGLEDAQNYRVKISPTGYGQASVTVMAVQHSKPTSVYVKQREITVIPTDPSKPTTPDITTSPDLPDADSDGWTRIYNGEQLTKALEKSRNILLMADVKNVKGYYSYSGILDGNGHTITNPIACYDDDNGGWIEYLKENAVIKNVNFASVNFTYDAGFYERGMIRKNEGTIQNCVIRSGKIKMDIAYSRFDMGGVGCSVGSFVGLNYGTILNCVNMADITAIHKEGSVTASGIAASMVSGSSITHCLNLGSIYVEACGDSANAQANGIVSGTYSNFTCSNNANAGKLQAITTGDYCKSFTYNIAFSNTEANTYPTDCYATQRYDDDPVPDEITVVSRDTLLSMWSDVLN